MNRQYTATAKRGPIVLGQFWRSAQSRDNGRTVRVVGRVGRRFHVEPTNGYGYDSLVSERTLRQGYALVGFWLVDEKGRRIGPIETHREALNRRLKRWSEKPSSRIGIACANETGIANKVTSGVEAEAARREKRR